jgi:hypothetical protein
VSDATTLLSGPWDRARIEEFLAEAVIPIRLASAGRHGPLVQSMWFAWSQGRLWCATQFDAVVVQRLRADPRVGFEVAGDRPPYRGVRGQGVAHLDPDRGADVLETLIGRYLGADHAALAAWLRSRAAGEVAIGIEVEHWASWDFTSRMRA